MGVLGLTSYTYLNSDIFFEDFSLMNCYLIIDGYSLASVLYNESKKMNSAFGGDYDKYSKRIESFVNILIKCRITPVVICDGGYELRKLHTVRKRNITRLHTLERINPATSNKMCFPLMMRHVFREKLLEIGVIVLQSDFEADNEIATIAKRLDAPVLSNDSDFLIFDVKYIPLASVSFDSYEKDENGNFFLSCSVYSVDKMLESVGGLSKTMLPLLATLLGNDYINAGQFKNFYSQLKINNKKRKPVHKRVYALMKWLKNETFDSAMYKVLSTMKDNTRRKVRRKIKNIIEGYTNLKSSLVEYLPTLVKDTLKSEDDFIIVELKEQLRNLSCSEDCKETSNIKVESEAEGSFEEKEDGCSCDSAADYPESDIESRPELEIDNPVELGEVEEFPKWLLDRSRRGDICPSVLTLLSLQTYFGMPTVQDYERPDAGSTAVPILQVIGGLLDLNQVRYWSRKKRRYCCSLIQTLSSLPKYGRLPKLLNICDLTTEQRKYLLLETINVENYVLIAFPVTWHLVVLTLIYWAKTNKDPVIKHWHIHAFVMMLTLVNVIASKTGCFWNKKEFLKKYGNQIRYLEKKENKITLTEDKQCTIEEAIEKVSFDECLLALNSLIPYFHSDESVERQKSRILSRSTVHVYAQFQSCFELLVTLNSLLLFPFNRCHLGNFYNGVLLYNFTLNLKRRRNIVSYVEHLFLKLPTVKNLYRIIYDCFEKVLPNIQQPSVKIRKPKLKSVTLKKEIEEHKLSEGASDSEIFEDDNNRFTLLLTNSIEKS